MANFLCFAKNVKDKAFLQGILITDVVLLSLISIFNIAHVLIFSEKFVQIFLAFNIMFLLLAIGVLVIFSIKGEVQTYTNFSYATMRQGWNIISIVLMLYLIGITCFRVYGYLNKAELTSIFVLYILYEVLIIIDTLLYIEGKRIVQSNFSALDGRNYIESNNIDEKNNRVEMNESWGGFSSDARFKGDSKKYHKVNEDNYYVNDSVQYINAAQNSLKDSKDAQHIYVSQDETKMRNSDTVVHEELPINYQSAPYEQSQIDPDYGNDYDNDYDNDYEAADDENHYVNL